VDQSPSCVKLTVIQLVKKFQYFMEPEGSSHCFRNWQVLKTTGNDFNELQ